MSRQSAHEGGKDVSPTHRPPLPPGDIPGTHLYRVIQYDCRGFNNLSYTIHLR